MRHLHCPLSGVQCRPDKADLTAAQIEDLVRRSYQYVAMFNVNNKFAMEPANPSNTGGWNRLNAQTELFDHTMKSIARPNNDTLYATTMSAVVTRIEVKDQNDAVDVADAQAVFDGITISGPTISEMPVVDLLSGFDEDVAEEARKRMDDTARSVPFTDMIVGPGQEPGGDVPYLYHSAGTKVGWGGPATSHSAYDAMFADESGETLDGSKGDYVLVTEAPKVNSFWSITVYDSVTGRLHPNDDDRYHFNNTTAVRNEDGTFTFRFKVDCEDGDQNCLEVPAGPFDVTARYYLPEPEIMNGEWTMPKPMLMESN